MGIWTPILTAAGGIVGGIYGGPQGAMAGASIGGAAGGYLEGGETNAANSQNARNQMDWQMHMSDTAHQREVKDLKKAGLNPILSANAGASTPSGAMATAQNPAEGLAASAMEAASFFQSMKKQSAEIGLIKAQTDKSRKEADILKPEATKGEFINKILEWGASKADNVKSYWDRHNGSLIPNSTLPPQKDIHFYQRSQTRPKP